MRKSIKNNYYKNDDMKTFLNLYICFNLLLLSDYIERN